VSEFFADVLRQQCYQRETLVTKLRFILFIILAFPGAATSAAPRTFFFSGSIDSIYDPLKQLNGIVAIGTPFHGHYTFDPNAVDSNSAPTLAQYRSTGADYQYVAAVGGMTFTRRGTDGPAGIEIVVGNNNAGLDVYDVQGAAGSLAGGPSFSAIGDVVSGIYLRDGDQTAFSSTALPLEPPNLAPFNDSTSSPNYNANLFNIIALHANQSILFTVSGPVDFLAVPEPAASLAFVSGLSAVALSNRRRKTLRRVSSVRSNRLAPSPTRVSPAI